MVYESDFERAGQLFREMQNDVDVFGLGGAEFGIHFEGRYYELRAISPLTRDVDKPVVDGSGVRSVVERSLARFVCMNLDHEIANKRVLFCVSTARWDLVLGFHEAGFEKLFGDPGYVFGIPFTGKAFWLARTVGYLFLPVVTRLPFKWLYPTGTKQHMNQPKFRRWFNWAEVIADDFHYIKRHLPERIDGKIIVTNTTTADDQEMLRQRGAKYLVTSTPVLDGRSFGTNVFEAAITAAAGHDRQLTNDEIESAIKRIGFEPTITKLSD